MNIPQDIKEIFHKFKAAGRKLYVVGGGVRDHVMCLIPEDVDMATDAMPAEIETILQGYNFDFTGKAFGVMRVYTPNAPKGYEIATFRKDISAGRNPQVQIGVSIDVDVFRRDLTINALFYDINEGKIVDLVDGLIDIQTKTIRTPGNPKDRFNEDKLRILRAIRFAARFNFGFDEPTWQAIIEDNMLVGPDESGRIVPLSQERISEEFLKGLKQCDIEYYIEMLNSAALLPQIFPGLVFDASYKNLTVRTPEVVIAMLLRDNTLLKVISNKLIYGCKFKTRTVDGVVFLLKLHSLNSDNAYEMKKSMPKNDLTSDDIMAFSFYAGIDRNLARTFCHYDITTTGEQLMKEGFAEGQELGMELKRREKANFERLFNHIREKE